MGNRSFFNALHDREGDFLLATVLEGPAQGERVLLRNTAPVWPEKLPAFWGEHLPALAAVTSSGILKSAGQRIFVERFGAAPQLVVCGGGHVGASVVRLAKLLGLPVTALEDRPEFAEELRQAGADAVLCLPFAEGLAQIPGGQETYFVVVTRAHSCDIACLRSILQKPAAYVGMMGSRKRAALVHTQLAELGLPQERIDALHAPIGLSIGAKTAQEIALSILAEIVSVKNSRQQTEGFSPALLAALEQQTAPAQSQYCFVLSICSGARSRDGVPFPLPCSSGFCFAGGGSVSRALPIRQTGSVSAPSAQNAPRIPCTGPNPFSAVRTNPVRNAPLRPTAPPMTPVARPLRPAYHFWAQDWMDG